MNSHDRRYTVEVRYSPYQTLGEGSFGRVLKAFDASLQRDVALKILSAQVAEDPEIRQRFVREARLLASIQHPGVVRVFDVTEFEGLPAYAMELVSGESLRQRIARCGRLSIEEGLEVFESLASTLCFLHGLEFFHRDLKPENIIVCESFIKVVDFGLAKSADSTMMTAAGAILGTPRYMAPETLVGKPDWPAQDVWSLGAIAYELLAGRPFVKEQTLSRILKELQDRPQLSDQEFPVSIPQGLLDLLAGALSPHPAFRLSSRDLAVGLEQLRRGKKVKDLAGDLQHTQDRTSGGPARHSKAWLLIPLALVATGALVRPGPPWRSAPDRTAVAVSAAPAETPSVPHPSLVLADELNRRLGEERGPILAPALAWLGANPPEAGLLELVTGTLDSRGERGAALQLIARRLESHPEDSMANGLQAAMEAKTILESGRPPDAATMDRIRACYRLHTGPFFRTWVATIVGELERQHGSKLRARQAFEASASTASPNASGIRYLAELRLELEGGAAPIDEIEELFHRAARLEPDSPAPHQALERAFQERGLSREAGIERIHGLSPRAWASPSPGP